MNAYATTDLRYMSIKPFKPPKKESHKDEDIEHSWWPDYASLDSWDIREGQNPVESHPDVLIGSINDRKNRVLLAKIRPKFEKISWNDMNILFRAFKKAVIKLSKH